MHELILMFEPIRHALKNNPAHVGQTQVGEDCFNLTQNTSEHLSSHIMTQRQVNYAETLPDLNVHGALRTFSRMFDLWQSITNNCWSTFFSQPGGSNLSESQPQLKPALSSVKFSVPLFEDNIAETQCLWNPLKQTWENRNALMISIYFTAFQCRITIVT